MALVLMVKSIEGLKCKGNKVNVKVSFRSASHYSKNVEESGGFLLINESFTWNLGKPVEELETVQFLVLSCGIFRNEVIARYGLNLKGVVEEGRIVVEDSLVDLNNKPLPAILCFDIRYYPPGGSCSSYAESEIMEDEEQMLIDIKESIANFERHLEQASISAEAGKRKGSWHSPQKTSKRSLLQRGSTIFTPHKSPDRKSRSSTLRSMRSFMKLGKQRPPRARSCDSGSDTSELLDRRDSSCATSNEPSRTNSMTSLETNVSDYESQGGAVTAESQDAIVKPTKKSKPKVPSFEIRED